MKNCIFIIMIFLTSCTTKLIKDDPLGYSLMPAYLNIDSIQPFKLDDTNRVVDSTIEDFVSVPIDGGKLIGTKKDTLTLPSGVLISDHKAMLYPFYKSSWERQQKELKYTKYLMTEYYDKAKTAETMYQREILKLEKQAERSWLEKNIGYIGFLSGIATAVLMSFALLGGTNFVK